MSDWRLPTIVYIVLVLFAVIYCAQMYPQLPERMASHFGADGRANGYSPKEFFFALMGMVMAISAVPAFLVPLTLRNTPQHKLNLPNKGYWLAPERAEDTYRFFKTWMAWFGCALLCVLLYGTSMAMKANLDGAGQFDSDAMMRVMMGFAIFVGVWLVVFVRHFRNVPSSQ